MTCVCEGVHRCVNQCYQRCLASKLVVLVDGDLIRTLQPLKLRRLCVGLTTASSLIKTYPALAGIGCTLHCSRTACSAMKQMTCPGYAACCLCSSSQQMIQSIGATIHLCFHEEHHVKQLRLTLSAWRLSAQVLLENYLLLAASMESQNTGRLADMLQ